MSDETNTFIVKNPDKERRQLSLPLPGLIERPPKGMTIPQKSRVYVNRNLRMARIDWVGFDMDYTLAIYRQKAMDALSVRLTIERLIQDGYPEYLADLDFDTRFAVRGLLIDKERGNILKMDRHQVVHLGYHGTKALSRKDLHLLYGQEKLRPASKRYHWIDTLFAMCEVTSYAAIISAMESKGESVDPEKLFCDVRAAIDFAHAEGTIYQQVGADLAKYIERDPALPQSLHKLRSAGKRLFVLTNSPYHYTETVMSYLLDSEESRYEDWKQYFDVIVCSARKPRWFEPQEKGKETEFLQRSPELPIKSPATRCASSTFKRGTIYEGGCLQLFEDRLEILGSSVLYIGDHIYGDILRSKKDSTWRTALVLQELDKEIEALQASADLRVRRRHLAESRPLIEDELRYYVGKLKELDRKGRGNADDLAKNGAKAHISRLRSALNTLESEYKEVQTQVRETFHPYWGSLLKEMNGLSIFGQQVSQYADIYMRRVSNLGSYSPTQFFRSPHDLMPHEM